MPLTIHCPVLFENQHRSDLIVLNEAISAGKLCLNGDHYDLPLFLEAVRHNRFDYRGTPTDLGALISSVSGGVYSKPFYSSGESTEAPLHMNRAWEVFLLSSSFCNGITSYTVMLAMKATGSRAFTDAEQIHVDILRDGTAEARLDIKPTGCPGT